jgi:hypothetical protein
MRVRNRPDDNGRRFDSDSFPSETMARMIHPENPHGPTIRSSQTEGAGQDCPADQALSASTNRGSRRTTSSAFLSFAPKHVSTGGFTPFSRPFDSGIGGRSQITVESPPAQPMGQGRGPVNILSDQEYVPSEESHPFPHHFPGHRLELSAPPPARLRIHSAWRGG